MSPENEYALVGGGETTLHTHPLTISHDILQRLDTITKSPTVTGDTTLTGAEDFVLVDTSAGNITITLPRKIEGLVCEVIKPNAAYTVTILPQAGMTILGAAGATLTAAGSSARFKLFGTDWKVI